MLHRADALGTANDSANTPVLADRKRERRSLAHIVVLSHMFLKKAILNEATAYKIEDYSDKDKYTWDVQPKFLKARRRTSPAFGCGILYETYGIITD